MARTAPTTAAIESTAVTAEDLHELLGLLDGGLFLDELTGALIVFAPLTGAPHGYTLLIDADAAFTLVWEHSKLVETTGRSLDALRDRPAYTAAASALTAQLVAEGAL